ncbi:uncharacterized protein LOC135953833 [Calliphora vicina]|uniref:uncharacterized protein LOC135953833 n=1 Tax=Calliphora vicina TaxID=7373 RepID=UPI00325AC12E
MIGLGEEVVADPFYTVPQNSTTNVNQKLELHELQPLENSTKNVKQKNCQCPHCENMAKNFLYLESLIRSNHNASNNCNVCHSSLQYLEYVNKSIMKVFGNFDAVAQAAKAFGHNIKPKTKLAKLRSSHAKRLTASNQLSPKQIASHHVRKMPSNVLKAGRKVQGSFSKNAIGSSRKRNKKSKFKKIASKHSEVKPMSLTNVLKLKKEKKLKALRSKTKNLLHKLKSKK